MCVLSPTRYGRAFFFTRSPHENRITLSYSITFKLSQRLFCPPTISSLWWRNSKNWTALPNSGTLHSPPLWLCPGSFLSMEEILIDISFPSAIVDQAWLAPDKKHPKLGCSLPDSRAWVFIYKGIIWIHALSATKTTMFISIRLMTKSIWELIL